MIYSLLHLICKRRAVGSCFVVRGWVKMSTTMVGRQRKIKAKHWLKRPRAVPQKNHWPNWLTKYKWFKISYLEFFFWKYYFGHTTFLYFSRSSSGHHQSFFYFRFSSRKPQRQQKLAKNNTHFTTQFLLKKPHSFYERRFTWHWK